MYTIPMQILQIPPISYPNARRDEKVQDTYPGNVVVRKS